MKKSYEDSGMQYVTFEDVIDAQNETRELIDEYRKHVAKLEKDLNELWTICKEIGLQ